MFGKDVFLSHDLCDLEKIVNDTYKYPNIIKDYDTAKKLFPAEYTLIMEKCRENTVSELFTATRDKIQKQRRKAREYFRNLHNVVKESWEAHTRDPAEKQPGI